MKNTIKLVLVVVLFCSTAFADGSMGAGGFAGDGVMTGGGFADDGVMGNGKTCTGNCLIENQPIEQNTNESDNSTAIITFVRDYLFSIFN